MSQELESNSVLLNKYRIESKLGQGGFGAVYLATDIALNRKVAIKTISPRHSLGSTPDNYNVFTEYLERFQREAMVSSFFTQNRNIIVVYALERDGDAWYLVLEYLENGSLSQLLKQPISIERACTIALDICNALHDIHEHPAEIVHRDLKPANILLRKNGEAVVADFGIAQVGQLSQRTAAPSLTHPGSPAYRSPEQANHSYYLTPASDLYSLGLILYEMLTGKLFARFKILPPSQLNSKIPGWLDALVVKLLQENPAERYQAADEVAAILREKGRKVSNRTDTVIDKVKFYNENDEVTLPVGMTVKNKPTGEEPTTILQNSTQAGPTFEPVIPTVANRPEAVPATVVSNNSPGMGRRSPRLVLWVTGAVVATALAVGILFLVFADNNSLILSQAGTATPRPTAASTPSTTAQPSVTSRSDTPTPGLSPEVTAVIEGNTPPATVPDNIDGTPNRLMSLVEQLEQKKQLIMGPRSGKLTQRPNGDAALYSTDPEHCTDFIIEAKFYNAISPVPGTAQKWDYGFFFRLSDNAFYYLYVTPERRWKLIVQESSDGDNETVAEGRTTRLNVEDTDSNELRLLVSGKQAIFYVNGFFVAELKLDKISSPGTVAVGTGATKNTTNDKYSPNIVSYENLFVYTLD